jgi:hypothetical protein
MARPSLQHLTEQARTLDCALGNPELDRLADLTLRIMQDATRRAGGLLTEMQSRTYAERSDAEREGMRSTMKHVVFALVLLEVIDVPH